jgi:hypothetical protein
MTLSVPRSLYLKYLETRGGVRRLHLIKAILMHIPAWSHLRAIGNSGPAKLTILIPLIGYFLIFNSQLAHYLELVAEVGGFNAHQFSVSPRLLLIYFGLCAFAVGSALYSFRCPNDVKQYGTSSAHVTGDGPSIKDYAFEPIEKMLANSSYAEEYQKLRNRFESLDTMSFEDRKQQIHNGILHLYFWSKNYSYTYARLIVSVSYAIGFVCLLISSIGVFFRVVRILWNVVRTVPFSVL